MRKTKFAILIAGITIIAIASGFDSKFPYGIAGRTGSPGETTCIFCHTTFPLNDGTGSVSISSPDLIGWEYNCGQTYTINVTVARTADSLFGFDCECLDTSNQSVGNFTVTNTETHIGYATIQSVVRENMMHAMNGGVSPALHTFTFNWTAPATNIGDVTFWIAGNAANGNYAPSGDHIYSTSQNVTPVIGTGMSVAMESNTGFAVFPNPSQGQLTLKFSGVAGEEINIQLISIEGKEISLLQHQIADGSAKIIRVKLPVDLQKGIYFVRLSQGAFSSSQRIIVE